ncbi:MAG TPA: C1 family peptidase [Levilinea sp.]|nr:C1 family peptidase [Levilinea sp.]
MKNQSMNHRLRGVSISLLLVMLAYQLFTGLPSPAFAQAYVPIDNSQIPLLLQDQLTPTPDPEQAKTEQTSQPVPLETSENTSEEVGSVQPDPSLLIWSLEMDLPVPGDQVQAMGGSDQAALRLLSTLDSQLDADVNIQLHGSSTGAQGTTFRVALEGASTPQDFRQLLFASLGSDFDLLGGPVELQLSGAVTAGQSIALILESRPATGYTWSVAGYDATLIAVEGLPESGSKASTPGAPAWERFALRALADGDVNLRLVYQRPFDAGEPATRRLALQTQLLPLELDLSSPLAPFWSPAPELPGPDPTLQALQQPAATAALPSTFDWRAQGKVPAVRDQGSCGSCWAFGTTGVMESALMIQGLPTADLSEQYLISCNISNWGCSGGWWAHDLHTNIAGKSSNPPGAALESAFPYSSSNGTCSRVYDKPYTLAAWRYVSGINLPSVDAIKAAIYTYGPVAAAVCSIGWGSYTGGVYSNHNTSCAGGIDHAIILVGWNDADQTWILRNSWGPRWGEEGYMRIKWGTSNVGFGATYVIPNKPPVIDPPRNDDFDNAVSVANPGGRIDFRETLNVAGATKANDDPTFPFSSGAITGESTVWYRFSTVNNGTLTLTTAGSNYDTVMGVWTGTRGLLTRVRWNDNAATDVTTSRISFAASPNTTYYINVASRRTIGKNLAFRLSFTPPTPPNNAIENAIRIPFASTGANYTEIRDIWNATTVSTDPKFPLDTGATAGFRTVWYTIRPTSSGILTVDTAGSNFDSLLGVLRGSRLLQWNDNSGENVTSSVSIRLAGQVTYRIMVSSKVTSPESRMQLNVRYLPDTPVEPGIYDNSHSAIAYVGNWTYTPNAGAYEGSIHQAVQTWSIANLTFIGTGVDFLFTRQVGGGSVDIFINGVRIISRSQGASIDRFQQRWSSATLRYGRHNITIVSTTSAPTNIDAFVVRP